MISLLMVPSFPTADETRIKYRPKIASYLARLISTGQTVRKLADCAPDELVVTDSTMNPFHIYICTLKYSIIVIEHIRYFTISGVKNAIR